MAKKRTLRRVRPNWTIHPSVITLVEEFAKGEGRSVSNAAELLLRSHPRIAVPQSATIG